MRLLLDGLAGVRFLLRGEFRNAFAVLHAYTQAHFMKGSYSPPDKASAPSYSGSIVVDYFLRGVRKFSQLDPARLDG